MLEISKEFKKSIKILIPYDKGGMLGIVHSCEILSSESREDGYYFEIMADTQTANRLKAYELKAPV